MEQPLVSVRLMVYNNEPYIREAVESVLMQQTTFKVEVVVGDDFSTDNTLDIIKSYKNTENITIKILDRKINDTYWNERKRLGRLYNFVDILSNCTGRYLALLDGDDYWTDSYKLQKQVDFLESNKEYNYCGHNSFSLKGQSLEKYILDIKEFGFEQLIFKNPLNSASLVFRKASFKLPDFFTSIEAGDWAVQLLSIKNSKAFILEEFMSVYRVHDESIWNSISKRDKCLRGVKLQEAMKTIYSDKYSIKLINEAIFQRKKNFGLIRPSLFNRILKRIS